MAGNAQGALKIAAKRRGLSVEEYERRVADGEKWCRGCSEWHPVQEFSADRSRGDGRKTTCRSFDRACYAETYVKIPLEQRKSGGPPRAAPRPGDKRQARRRINVLVRTGRLARPNALPCVDCGHVWKPGERRHEYDHHLGYAAEHHLEVEVVCSRCHHRRENDRSA